jgi:CRISPR/Cas system-associated endonuclease Cas3-HD
MAPGFYYQYISTSTQWIYESTGSGILRYSSVNHEQRKPETKKEKKDRVSKALMHASWDLHNKKTISIRQVKRICKPQHRVTNKNYI